MPHVRLQVDNSTLVKSIDDAIIAYQNLTKFRKIFFVNARSGTGESAQSVDSFP